MDGKRFDDLARAIASPTDRRSVFKALFGGLALALGGFFQFGRDGAAAPLSAAQSADFQPAPAAASEPTIPRSARRAGQPRVRPAIKGSPQVAPAGTPVMSFVPTSGKVKSSVQATISGFQSAETITLLWFDGATSKPIATGLTSSGGKATITFTAPYAYRGWHMVRAQGNKGSVAEAKFAIVPSFTLKPKKGPDGTAVKASLSGFAKNATIDVYFYTTADRTGTASKRTTTVLSGTGTGAANFTIPTGATLGIHRIEGRERATGKFASAKFVVTCATAADCPQPAGECSDAACVNGVCGTSPKPAGTPLANQTAGDCLTHVCDGAGGTTSIPADDDLPADDGNDCTEQICQNGTPAFVNKPEGTACSGGTCDGSGLCTGQLCQPGSTQVCYSGPPGTMNVGLCQAGMRTCLQDGSGFGPCQGEILPTAELCNDLDDDCDGVIDDGFEGKGQPCTNGQMGICQKSGVMVCSPDGSSVICNAPPGTPQPEICNGLDDDCDGLVDEGAVCPQVPNSLTVCQSGACIFLDCNFGFGNCNGNPADGCETNLMTNVLHCGSCGHACTAPTNGSAICQSGVCAVVCNQGFTNCSGSCKDLENDRLNCGFCGNACSGGQICSAGVCELIG